MKQLVLLVVGRWILTVMMCATAYMSSPCHVEMILCEKGAAVKPEEVGNLVSALSSSIVATIAKLL